MSNFTDPIKAAFGRYMGDYYSQLIADTPALREFAGRGLAKSIVWAPGRMVDQVEEMMTAWRRNDTSAATQPTPFVPIMIAAMAKDYTPAPDSYAVPQANYVDVMVPGDPLQRAFKMRAVMAHVRTQIAIIATEESTARSLAMQLHVFACASVNRRFHANYPLVGVNEPWPVTLETPDILAVNTPNDAKNLTILVADIMLLATVPMLSAPKGSEPHDNKGAGTAGDPHGYLVVTRGDISNGVYPGMSPAKTWTVGGP
jgi:hypothetical protein